MATTRTTGVNRGISQTYKLFSSQRRVEVSSVKCRQLTRPVETLRGVKWPLHSPPFDREKRTSVRKNRTSNYSLFGSNPRRGLVERVCPLEFQHPFPLRNSTGFSLRVLQEREHRPTDCKETFPKNASTFRTFFCPPRFSRNTEQLGPNLLPKNANHWTAQEDFTRKAKKVQDRSSTELL